MSSSRRWDPTDGGHLRIASNKGEFGLTVHCSTKQLPLLTHINNNNTIILFYAHSATFIT